MRLSNDDAPFNGSPIFKKGMGKLKTHNPSKYEFFRDKYIYNVSSFTPVDFEKFEIDFR